MAARSFVLEPYPFEEPELRFEFPARYVEGWEFGSLKELQRKFSEVRVRRLAVTVGVE